MNQYNFILNNMIFSFSRLTTYETCPYGFYLTYIEKKPRADNAFAQYGTLCHNLLERFANGEIMVFELLDEYEKNYNKYITKEFPPNKWVVLKDTYYQAGYEYFSNFEGFNNYSILEVEKEVKFNIDKYPFIGYIDLVLKNDNGEIEIVDHKSKNLKMPHKNTWDDTKRRRKTEMYKYLRQLYIYSIPLIEQDRVRPKYLNFNCFRKNNWFKIPFDDDDYEECKEWALGIIHDIYADKDMKKTYEKKRANDTFFCDFICSNAHHCPNSNRYIENIE